MPPPRWAKPPPGTSVTQQQRARGLPQGETPDIAAREYTSATERSPDLETH